MNTVDPSASESSLDKVTNYVVEVLLGGSDDTEDARRTREVSITMINTLPEKFLSFARSMLCKHGSCETPGVWVMGAIHAFRDQTIKIEDKDVDAAARHVMEAIKQRFSKS